MKSKVIFGMIVLILAIIGMAGCAPSAPQEPQITVEEPWARAASAMEMDSEGGMGAASDSGTEMEGSAGMQGAGGTSAAYMVLKNSGREADRLLEVQTDVAEVVETHLSEERDGVMVMSQVEGIDVPAQGQTELKPGGLHIMLINLTQDLKPGETINLTLIFEKSDPIQIAVPVREP